MMPNAHPLIGRTLEGRFSLTGFIGEGAMATVFKGTDSATGGEVAVKVMHPHLAEDRTFAGRFRQEAKAAAMLTHPNSVRIVHFGEDSRIHFIVMELVSGRDLRDVLKLERRLSETRAANIVANVCDALDAAHRIGIIHRDLKPENIMVLPSDKPGGSDVIKVLDFGIAKLVDKEPNQPRPTEGPPDSEPPPALTQVGVVVGTPAYMSPEQCRGQPLDGRSDLYTCGILLYQLTTGRVPFDSPSPFEVAGKQAFEAPPPPSQFLENIYPPLEALILKVLSKSPADRPQTALELRDQLRLIHAQLDAGPLLPGRPGGTIPLMASKGLVDKAEAVMAARQALEASSGHPALPVAPMQPPDGFGPPMGVPPGATSSPGMQPGMPQRIPNHDPIGQFLREPQPQPAPFSPPGLGGPPAAVPTFGSPTGAPPLAPGSPSSLGGGQGAPLAPAFGQAAMTGLATAPSAPDVNKPAKRGAGGAMTLLSVLLSMGAGVGLGYALYHFVGM
jgi:serine/threonine protein kinase